MTAPKQHKQLLSSACRSIADLYTVVGYTRQRQVEGNNGRENVDFTFPVPAFPVKNTFWLRLTSSRTSLCMNVPWSVHAISLRLARKVRAGLVHMCIASKSGVVDVRYRRAILYLLRG